MHCPNCDEHEMSERYSYASHCRIFHCFVCGYHETRG